MPTSTRLLVLRCLPAIIAATSISSACIAGGNDILWNNILGGSFDAPLNWIPEIVPGESDNAIFDTDKLYTVTFLQNLTINEMAAIDGDFVTFNLSGFTYVINELVIGEHITEVGSLTIVNGVLSSSIDGETRIGKDIGSEGELIITSTGSFAAFGNLIIGDAGIGALTIQPGGSVTSVTAFIGDDPGANGTTLVTGPNAQWSLSNNLIVGNNGNGELTIASGGIVNVQGQAKVGDLLNANGSVIVTGTNSSFTTNGGFSLGNDKDGSLTITNGGSASHHGGLTRIGDNLGGNGLVSVDGAGSTWTCSTELFIGNLSFGSVSVANGATANTSRVKVGDEIGSTGIITINGKGSLWNDSVEIFVGNFGTGTATVSGGAQVIANVTTIGDDPGSNGSIIVEGAGSTWNSSSFTNGDLGNGILQISNNGQIQVSSYIQSADGTLNIQIGPAFVTSVNSSGNAQLAGSLTLSLASGYSPSPGEQFTILSANSRNGTFTQINTPANLEVSYESNSVVVTVTDAVVCETDLDSNGSVGTGDLLILLGLWGTNPGGPPDFDGDGIVGTSDLLTLLANWGPCK